MPCTGWPQTQSRSSDASKSQWYWAPQFEFEEPEEGTPSHIRRQRLQAELKRVPQEERLPIELGVMVRVKMDEEIFQESGPQKAPKVVLPGVATEGQSEEPKDISPWTLVVSDALFAEDGSKS